MQHARLAECLEGVADAARLMADEAHLVRVRVRARARGMGRVRSRVRVRNRVWVRVRVRVRVRARARARARFVADEAHRAEGADAEQLPG